MRNVQVSLWAILDLVHAGETCGWLNSSVMGALADFAGVVTDSDIEEFASRYLTEEFIQVGYSEEDYESAKEVVTEWRDRYCEDFSE